MTLLRGKKSSQIRDTCRRSNNSGDCLCLRRRPWRNTSRERLGRSALSLGARCRRGAFFKNQISALQIIIAGFGKPCAGASTGFVSIKRPSTVQVRRGVLFGRFEACLRASEQSFILLRASEGMGSRLGLKKFPPAPPSSAKLPTAKLQASSLCRCMAYCRFQPTMSFPCLRGC